MLCAAGKKGAATPGGRRPQTAAEVDKNSWEYMTERISTFYSHNTLKKFKNLSDCLVAPN